MLALQRGNAAAAVDQIARSIALDPSVAAFYSNLGAGLKSLGQLDEAEAALRQALALAPDFVEPRLNLAAVFAARDRADAAVVLLREARRLAPQRADVLVQLGYACGEVGLVEEAADAYRAAVAVDPSPANRILEASLLPLVYRSEEDLDAWRVRLTQAVGRLHADRVRMDVERQPAIPVFALAHQGEDDRPLNEALAALYRPPPQPAAVAGSSDGRIRVGFVSSYFSTHTIGKLFAGLIDRLPRDQFAVCVLALAERDDPVAAFIRRRADRYLRVYASVDVARRQIADERLDLLFYCDIGMDPLSYTLALSRLAPVQCATCGHPVTTGMKSIDYFVSGQWLETDEADDQYTERLVRLESNIFALRRPDPPTVLPNRTEWGFDPQAHLYFCPQSIYKFHPRFDRLLGEILRRDPQGLVVLVRWAYEEADERLRQRFARTMPDVAGRVWFVPRMQQGAFTAFLTLADVLLDPTEFGSGWTAVEGLALGVPIVTLPGRFLRNRFTYGLYRQLGVLDCVARSPDDYVELAVRLGRDREFNAAVRARILAAGGALFDPEPAVAAMGQFLERAARAGCDR